MSKEEKAREKSRGALTAWEPFAELREGWPFRGSFPSRFERLLRELDEDWPAASLRGGFAPALDVHESDDHYVVSVELPGVGKDDVTVELDDGMLTVRGEKRGEREEKKKEKRRFVERRYGSFSRSFTLPRDADPDRIEAGFKDGVLTLTIAKNEAAKPRTVAIK